MSVSTTPMPVTVGTASPSVPDLGSPAALSRPARLAGRRGASGRRASLVAADAVAAAGATALGGIVVLDVPLLVLPAAVVGWTAAVRAAGGHRVGHASYADRSRRVLRAAVGVALTGWIAAALSPGLLGTDPVTALRAGILGCALVAVLSVALGAAATRLTPSAATPVVLVGAPEALEPVLAELAGPQRRWEPVAVCSASDASVVEAVQAHGARAVLVVPGHGLAHDELRRLGAALRGEGADLLVATGLRDVAAPRVEQVAVGSLRAVHVRPVPVAGPARWAKEVVDRVLAAVLLVALAPLLLAVAWLVRADSPGPAVYRQLRVGRHGRLFTVYKFRSMRTDADAVRSSLLADNESDGSGVLFKIRQDPRITRVGATLRRYSLDELPQLLNVVRGEMSLIGPRPPLPQEVRGYSHELWRRMTVKPGLTGLWQVSGRSDLSWEETVRLDLAYVDNWSWTRDLAIAVRTVGAVLGHRGAY